MEVQDKKVSKNLYPVNIHVEFANPSINYFSCNKRTFKSNDTFSDTYTKKASIYYILSTTSFTYTIVH